MRLYTCKIIYRIVGSDVSMAVCVCVRVCEGADWHRQNAAAKKREEKKVMTVFSFYLFDRSGTCLTYKQWKRPRQIDDADDDQKNMFGMLFALRNFASKLSPKQEDGVSGIPKFFITDVYALHYFETPTGYRFVLTTGADFGDVDVSHHLSEIYATIFVQLVLKNPLYVVGQPIEISTFATRLDEYVRELPCF